MKHILNNLSEKEKKSILEQHKRQKRINEFFEDGRTWSDNKKVYYEKTAEQLSKSIMISISVIGREKTSELLRNASEMISQAENTTPPNSAGYDYSIVDLKSDIEDYLLGNTSSLEEQYDDDGKWVTRPPYEGFFEDSKIMLVREDADVVKYTLNNLPDSIEYIAILNCEYADFSGVDLCDKKDLVFINLAGTENNFEEQDYECAYHEGETIYTFFETRPPNRVTKSQS